MRTARFRLASPASVSLWPALRVISWHGFCAQDARGCVSGAIRAAPGHDHGRNHVNGLNVGTTLPVALPIRILGKREVALALSAVACPLAGLLSMAGSTRIPFGRPHGLPAACLSATHPGDVFFSTVVMPDALQSGWVTFSLVLVVAACVPPESQRGVMLAVGAVLPRALRGRADRPCPTRPPVIWRLVCQGHPGRIFQIAAGDADARN